MKRINKVGYYFFVILLFMVIFPVMLMAASKRPVTASELAMYSGADRQQLLEQGAKKEGKLTFYTSGIFEQSVQPVVEAFQKKYPFVKLDLWRAGTNTLVPRITEEFKAGSHLADTIEGTQTNMMVLQKMGIVEPFFSPALADIEEGAITKASKDGGAVAVAFRSMGLGVGYNPKLISKNELPKTYQGLLDPKWKGKMALVGTNTGASWLGVIIHAMGEEFAEKLAKQEFTVHMVAPPTLLDMIINGEYAFSPTIYESNVASAKRKGASTDWIPLEPVHVNVGQIALAKNPPHPYSAMLFIDFQLSKESAILIQQRGYDSLRKDVPSLSQPYKKYFGADSLESADKEQERFKKLFLTK